MRRAVVAVLTFLLSSCADDGKPVPTAPAKCVEEGNPEACEMASLTPGVSACAFAQRLHSETLAALKLAAPACTRDADCVTRSTRLDCRGVVVINLCSNVMHREAAERWNAEQLCTRVLERTLDDGTGCAIEASCIAPGQPRCRGGECVGAHL